VIDLSVIGGTEVFGIRDGIQDSLELRDDSQVTDGPDSTADQRSDLNSQSGSDSHDFDDDGDADRHLEIVPHEPPPVNTDPGDPSHGELPPGQTQGEIEARHPPQSHPPMRGARADRWWEMEIENALLLGRRLERIDIQTLLFLTLQNSPQVHVLSDQPRIQSTFVGEADAAFDWTSFLETRWKDTSDPVGNLLTTGVSDRFRDNHWTYRAGARRQNRSGGELEVGQEIGYPHNSQHCI